MTQQCILAASGYTCSVAFAPSYRGFANGQRARISAVKANLETIAVACDTWRAGHFQNIRSIQSKIPSIAKIADIIGTVVLFERAHGQLLWEMEKHDFTEKFLVAELSGLIIALRNFRLVHADIRPWNIFFDASSGKFTVIDWGFSFFNDRREYPPVVGHLAARGYSATHDLHVDESDLLKTIDVMMGRVGVEQAWNHPPTDFIWRPSWAKRL